MKKLLSLCLVLSFALSASYAEAAKPKKSKKNKTEVADTTKKAPQAKKGSIESVIKKGAEYHSGLFNVVEQEGKYYFLISQEQLGRDYLVSTRLSQGSSTVKTPFSGYAGDPVSQQLVRFNLSPDGKKVILQSISTREMPRDTASQMYENVMRSNFQPIVESFEVKGNNEAKDTLLIEVTDFLTGDNSITSFSEWSKRSLGLSQYQAKRSYISEVKSFPINAEFKSVKTYMYTPSIKSFDGKPFPSSPASFEINTSFVELPEVPMQPRYADDRVGYFTERYVDYDKNPQGVKQIQMISRWRLEPKEEDMEAYMRGELVEPKEPIIYYIDPTTPKEWVPYLMQGVDDWEPAFRAAGFKNAIMAKEAPVGDTTWSLEDARHSAIVYKPSTTPNASGPHIKDPRTGQILESHVNWYHNVMLLLRNWYMVQVAPNDPRAQQMELPEELMGELIRFVSSHEIGHTLGLRHNFGSTAMVPVDSLRNEEYLKKYGHAPSIMDYSRFNYVVQPEDNISPELLFPRIGDYDMWAIEWGYRRFPELTTPEAEETLLNEWIIEKQKNPRLWFGHEMSANDPRSQAEDLGDNQMKANELGLKNLERVVKGLPEWTKVENQGYEGLKEIFDQVVTQYGRYVGHVAKWLGGIYETPLTVEQGSDVYVYVEKAKQEEAMKWLADNYFKAPEWLFDKEVLKTTSTTTMSIATTLYIANMNRIVSVRVINNLINAEAELGNKTYTVAQYFSDLNRYIMVSNPNEVVRLLQKVYVERLLGSLNFEKISLASITDAQAMVLAELRKIESKLKNSYSGNAVISAHNKYLVETIQNKLDK